jgi:hypothetical protein
MLAGGCATAPSPPVALELLQQASPFVAVVKVAQDPEIAELGLNLDSQPQAMAQGGAIGGGLLQLASELTASSQSKERISLLGEAWANLKSADHGVLVTRGFLSHRSPSSVSIGQVRLDDPSSAESNTTPAQPGRLELETAMFFSKDLEVLDISCTYRAFLQPTDDRRKALPDAKGEIHYLISPGTLSLDKAINASHWKQTLSGSSTEQMLQAAYQEIAGLIFWTIERGHDVERDSSLPSVSVLGIDGKDIRRTNDRIVISQLDADGRAYSVPLPPVISRTIKSVAVVPNPEDGRGLDDVLVGQLESRGFAVRKVATVDEARDDDAVVTYESKWIWDLVTYLNKVRLRILDPSDGSVLVDCNG